MIATTAKPSGLRTLLEAASPGCDCEPDEMIICVHRTEALQDLEDIAPALARLVLTLAEALELGREQDGPCDNEDVAWHKEAPCTLHISKSAERKVAALAAVEALEL